MAPLQTLRAQRRRAESDWRAAPGPKWDFDAQLDAAPRWLSAIVIMGIGALLWGSLLGAAVLLHEVLP